MIPAARLATLPKVELHLHLEGSLRPATVLALAERNGIDLGCDDEDALVERYRFRDFLHFIELFYAGLSVLQTPDDLVTAADALTTELAAQNVRWAEITTTPQAHLAHRGLAAAEYAGALDQAQRNAAAKGVEVRWILDISRGDELPDDHLTAGLLTGPDAPAGAVAMGLGGPEAEWPARLYVDTFAQARAAGVPAVVHAGEAAGPQSVVDALDLLHSQRIGHGVRALEDPALVERLVAEQVPIEVSPTSNVLLGITPGGIERHPIGELLRRGVNVSVNTDDPGYFLTTLTRELELVQAHHGVDGAGLVALQRRAIEASFAPAATRDAFLDELAKWEAAGHDD
ncbi:MAG: adenosine deaminase [Acidimicrobiia bacterium]|nr:adenosine deaminase [Acidimicrobiia bacterium]